MRNDGLKPREITLLLQFAGGAAGSKTMTLAAGSETQATFLFHAKAAGFLEARVTSTNGRGDAFPQDDAAVIEVPIGKTLRVAVYSPEPDLLKPLLAGNAQVEATFELPAKYDPQAASGYRGVRPLRSQRRARECGVGLDRAAGGFAVRDSLHR